MRVHEDRPRSLGLLVTVALAAVAGCGSKSLAPTSIDGATGTVAEGGAATAGDGGSCMCEYADTTLKVTWDCFCRAYACNQVETIYNCADTPGVWTRGCGYDEYTAPGAWGPQIWAYDQSGKLVGVQLSADEDPVPFSCPDNPTTLGRYLLKAGELRPGGCPNVVTCNCADTDAGAAASCSDGDGGLNPL